MLRWLLVALLFVILAVKTTAPAHAQEEMSCQDATIAALRACVVHVYDMGYIDNAGVEQSLLSQSDAAQAALDRGNTTAAVNLLNSFIRLVNAQSGIHIDAGHAAHIVMHAQEVIVAIEG